MGDSDNLRSSDSDDEVSFKQKRKVIHDPSTLAAASPGAVRRGNRPRAKPRFHADFLDLTPKKTQVAPACESSTEEDSDLESCRKKATSLFTDDDIKGQDMFQFKSRHTKLDLQNKVNSVPIRTPKTPRESTPKTRGRGRPSLNKRVSSLGLADNTPKHVTNMIKKRIIKEVESEDSDTDFSASSSDFVPEKSDESSSSAESAASEEAPRAVPRLPRANPTPRHDARASRRDTEYVVAPDNYFLMHSSKKITTSDHTLERLKNFNPTDARIPDSVHLTDEHEKRIVVLNKSYEHMFDRWLYVLAENYSVLLYGVGSKRAILQRFQATKLKDFPCVVVNGFFPSLTIKSVLEAIIVDLLECSQIPSNVRDAVRLIEEQLAELGMELFLIVHNIDGAMLQSGKAQSVLASLSQIRNVHTIATIDHINAPLIWDHTKLSKFNFTWWDATTFLPYGEECSFEGGLARAAGSMQLSSLRSVHRSLTDNARRVFRLIGEHQLRHRRVPHHQGMPFKELYALSREQFLVSSDIALRAQLTEFLDHKLLKTKRSLDGSENLTIPLESGLLQQFLDEMS